MGMEENKETLGPVLDWVARYDALDRRRRAFAEMAAEDLLRGWTDQARRSAEKYQELDQKIKRIIRS